MPRSLAYETYLDKVFGCWLGKCVSGTIGAPYEGMKQRLDFEYSPVFLEELIPNDDLDLQVLWLSVLEQKGVNFSAEDLAEAFSTRVPYAPGEYAVFKKNYRRGIAPPVCGQFNNRYFLEGMGAPIRSEVWACIAPGNPELAARYAAIDGQLDHAGNSVYAEQFFAAMEAEAFFESDLDRLVDVGLAHIPADSEIAALIRDVCAWSKSGRDWGYVRSLIIREYGHPSCTNLFENIGFTLLALYAGGGDLIKSTMIALNCGFDTDCSCATAGALLGIIHGADKLMIQHDLKDTGYLIEVDAPRRNYTIRQLAEDTCAMGIYFAERLNDAVSLTGGPTAPVIVGDTPPDIRFRVEYENDFPSIGLGETRRVVIEITNQDQFMIEGGLTLEGPEGWRCELMEDAISIPPGMTRRARAEISAPADLPVLEEKNLFQLTLSSALQSDSGLQSYSHVFGLAGAAVWKLFGPFWETSQTIRKLDYKENYMDLIVGDSESDRIDRLSRYHNNSRIDLDKEYLSLEEIAAGSPRASEDAACEGRTINIHTDRFSLSEISGFCGPAVFYLERILISPEDREACVQVGHTDAFELWINGQSVAHKRNVDWATGGNVNLIGFPIRRGENRIVLKLCRQSADADFSLILRRTNPWKDHFDDFASKNPATLFAPCRIDVAWREG